MSNDIEYIEPTQEHVGQMVEVRDYEQQNWVKARLLCVIKHEYAFIAQEDGIEWGVCYKYARIHRPLTYAERQAKCGLKVGDRVRFTRAWENSSEPCGIICTPSMQCFIGTTGVIVESCDNGLDVKFPSRCLWLPYFVLEKVEDREATRYDVGKQVYVDGAPQDVFGIEMIYGVQGDVSRAVVVKNDKRFVYELSNLRVKE